MCELGWKSLGVLELTTLPSIDKERWVRWVRETDVLLVNGGDPLYLCYWMRQSGLADLLPSLSETVWVGLSAGSMVMTPRIGEDFVQWKPPTGDDSTLGVIGFSIYGASLILLYSASTIYHGLEISPRGEDLLRRFDCAAAIVGEVGIVPVPSRDGRRSGHIQFSPAHIRTDRRETRR